jgi:hypothetical protein
MNQQACRNCGREISNEFGVTLTFCTNCGANLINYEEDKTLLSGASRAVPTQKQKSQLPAIFLTSILTSVFLLAILGIGWYLSYAEKSTAIQPNDRERTVLPDKTDARPGPRVKQPGSISPSDISKVSFTEFRHEGLLTGSGQNRSVSNRIGFTAEGTGYKIDGETTYEAGKKVGEKTTSYKSTISKEQFEQLARILVENDFLNEADSKERITDYYDYTLTVTYSQGEKKIKTSNVNQDTPEIEAILHAFRNLQNQVSWQKVDPAEPKR